MGGHRQIGPVVFRRDVNRCEKYYRESQRGINLPKTTLCITRRNDPLRPAKFPLPKRPGNQKTGKRKEQLHAMPARSRQLAQKLDGLAGMLVDIEMVTAKDHQNGDATKPVYEVIIPVGAWIDMPCVQPFGFDRVKVSFSHGRVEQWAKNVHAPRPGARSLPGSDASRRW